MAKISELGTEKGKRSPKKIPYDLNKLGDARSTYVSISLLRKMSLSAKIFEGPNKASLFVGTKALSDLRNILKLTEDEANKAYADWIAERAKSLEPEKFAALIQLIERQTLRRSNAEKAEEERQQAIAENIASGRQIVQFRKGAEEREGVSEAQIRDLASEASELDLSLFQNILSSIADITQSISTEIELNDNLGSDLIFELQSSRAKLISLAKQLSDPIAQLFDKHDENSPKYYSLDLDLKSVLIKQFGLSAEKADEVAPAVEDFIRARADGVEHKDPIDQPTDPRFAHIERYADRSSKEDAITFYRRAWSSAPQPFYREDVSEHDPLLVTALVQRCNNLNRKILKDEPRHTVDDYLPPRRPVDEKTAARREANRRHQAAYMNRLKSPGPTAQ